METVLKFGKFPKYCEQDCLKNFPLLFLSLNMIQISEF